MPRVKPTNLILLTGRPRVGKDYTAKTLVGEYGYKSLSFASPVKEAVSLVLNKPISYMEENKESYRLAYNRLGEGMKPLFGHSLWVSIQEPNITTLLTLGNNVVIPDLGFNIEYFYLRTRIPATTSMYVVRVDNLETKDTKNDVRTKLTVNVDYRIYSKYLPTNTAKGERELDLDSLRQETAKLVEYIK